MQTIDEIRLRNLEVAIAEAGGTLEKLAEVSGLNASYLSQIRNRLTDSKTGRPRNLGGRAARSIEKGLDKSHGWMDVTHSADLTTVQVSANAPTAAATAHVDHISVPVMNAVGSMGLGVPMPETESVVDVIKLAKHWVHENLRSITAPANLAAMSAHGDSMSPTFADGDILLVDRGVDEIKLDAVYVLALNDELYIKRIQRRITDGAIVIKSDNPLYDPVVVENGERSKLRVLGRIVWAWNGRKL